MYIYSILKIYKSVVPIITYNNKFYVKHADFVIAVFARSA